MPEKITVSVTLYIKYTIMNEQYKHITNTTHTTDVSQVSHVMHNQRRVINDGNEFV